MGATSNRNRNLRNNPYMFDELGGRFHRTAAGMLWRWRTELSALALLAALTLWLVTLITVIGALVLVLGLAALAVVLPPARRFITRHAWCVLTRHRLQHLCWEARLHTRAGRLPLILWIKPTPVGVRAFVLCRAGICAEDFEAHIGEIRAACYARDARVTRHPRWSQLVTIDIVRHDPLTPDRHVPSQVLNHHRRPPRPAAPELTGKQAS